MALPAAAAVTANEQPLVPIVKLKFPSVTGMPVPNRCMVCSPVLVKIPFAENEMPFTVFELNEYGPMVVTITFIEMVLAAVSEIPAVYVPFTTAFVQLPEGFSKENVAKG